MSKFTIHVTFESEHTHEITHFFHGLEALSELPRRLDCIEASIAKGFGEIMATLAEVQAELTALKADTEAEHQQAQAILDKVTALETQVADLQAQLAAGSAATPADLDGLLTQIRDIKTGVENIVP